MFFQLFAWFCDKVKEYYAVFAVFFLSLQISRIVILRFWVITGIALLYYLLCKKRSIHWLAKSAWTQMKTKFFFSIEKENVIKHVTKTITAKINYRPIIWPKTLFCNQFFFIMGYNGTVRENLFISKCNLKRKIVNNSGMKIWFESVWTIKLKQSYFINTEQSLRKETRYAEVEGGEAPFWAGRGAWCRLSAGAVPVSS